MDITEADVYLTLGRTTWKSQIEIWHEVQQKSAQHPDGVSIDSVYGHLKSLVDKDDI